MQQTIAAARSMKIAAQYVKSGCRFESRVCQAAVIMPARRVGEWHDVVVECQRLLASRRKHSDKIRCGVTIPAEYEKAAGCLEVLIINIFIGRSKDFMQVVLESPSSEDHYVYVKGPVPKTFFTRLRTTDETPEIYRTDPLFWCIVQMTNQPEEIHKLDPAALFAFFDDMVTVDKSAADRVDSRLLDHISDLAALWELLRAIRLQRPLAKSMQLDEALELRAGDGWEEPRALRRNKDALSGMKCKDEHSTIATLIPRLMAAKVPGGRRNQDWLQEAQESRAALSQLWDGYRGKRRLTLEFAGIPPEYAKAFIAQISFDKSAEYEQCLHNERAKIMGRLPSFVKPVIGGTRNRWQEPEPSKPRSNDFQAQTSTKVKTRPINAGDEGQVTEATVEQSAHITPAIMSKSESLQLFYRIFPSFEDGNEPFSSLTDWRKFVIAMADAGFTSRHNTGSAVTFSCEKGKIVFHKPHPVAKIDFRLLMRMGKRLNKWFGLERESFEAV